MRKLVYMFIVFTGLAFFASCGGDTIYYITEVTEKADTDTVVSPKPTTESTVINPLDSIGTASKPTDWMCISDFDPTRYMTLTMDATGLPVAISDDDMLAAFVGDECRGVTTPYNDVDGVVRYSMVIVGCAQKDESSNSTEQVELRYYSSTKHRIYLADKIDFKDGDMLGDVSTGYKPTWH